VPKDMPAPSKADAILTAATPRDEEPTLLDILDHVLNSGVVIQGSLVISLARVDLVYIGLNVVLTSVETALKHVGTEQASGVAD
jgi:gas vesicle structural protein